MPDHKLFTDDKLYEIFTQMNKTMTEMSTDMKHLRNDFKITDELKQEIVLLNKRLISIEEQTKGKNKVFEAFRLWGSWAIALAALIFGFYKGT